MKRPYLSAIGIAFLVLILIGVTASLVSSHPTGIPYESSQPRFGTTGPTADSYKNVPAGITADGHVFLGQADAPVTIEEYTDFLCPFCARHATQTLPGLIEKQISAGRVKYVLYDMPLVSLHPTAPKAHAAARCVAEQGAGLFWAMEGELFKNQEQWRQLPDPSEYLTSLAKTLGADPAAYGSCIASGREDGLVQQDVSAGQSFGFNGTPSFRFTAKSSGKSYTLVGAQPLEVFAQWVDTIIAGNEPAQEQPQAQQPQAAPQELPFWANAKGLAPDPKRPGFDMAGDPYRGSPDAKLVVVEFSNYQCPSCRDHELQVQPAIDKALVENGQVMWVFKNLPLRSLQQSTVAAAAAECAADQGHFWEMNRLLFQTQADWAADPPDPSLIRFAGQIGLDAGQFGACLNSRQALERVVNDMFDAQGVATNTPTFVAIYGGRGTVIKGSRPADQFVALLQGLLQPAGTPVPAGSQR